MYQQFAAGILCGAVDSPWCFFSDETKLSDSFLVGTIYSGFVTLGDAADFVVGVQQGDGGRVVLATIGLGPIAGDAIKLAGVSTTLVTASRYLRNSPAISRAVLARQRARIMKQLSSLGATDEFLEVLTRIALDNPNVADDIVDVGLRNGFTVQAMQQYAQRGRNPIDLLQQWQRTEGDRLVFNTAGPMPNSSPGGAESFVDAAFPGSVREVVWRLPGAELLNNVRRTDVYQEASDLVIEVKTGAQRYPTTIRNQIINDVRLIETERVDEVRWVFGPNEGGDVFVDQRLLDALDDPGSIPGIYDRLGIPEGTPLQPIPYEINFPNSVDPNT